ncbi:MAG TPA: orotate phosphoribosyltransferase [Candidatus Ozemobacteraceae bacterium]|nr:orotate phosphoribosyltransferase [Candidatus Ozemobacteraceae bacterium]
MNSFKRSIVEVLIECGALKFGEFKLKSGRTSPFFVDIGKVSSGKRLEFIGDSLAQTVNAAFPDVNFLFGPAYKGISLATAVAGAYWRRYGRDLAVCFDRKEAKDHGEGGTLIGTLPAPTHNIVIIDDVLSDGATKREALRSIEKAFKVTPIGVTVAVDRSPKGSAMPFKAVSLINLADICDFLSETGDARASVVQTFWEAAS